MQRTQSYTERNGGVAMNETLRNAEIEIEEENKRRGSVMPMQFEHRREMTIEKIESRDLKPSSDGGSAGIQPEVLEVSSQMLKREGSRSMRLLNSSAVALHSHLKRVLDTTNDVRPTLDRTEQAMMCAQNIALLIRTQSEMMRSMRELDKEK